MSSSHFRPARRSARRRTALSSLLCAFIVTSALAKAERPAGNTATPATPPAFPDAVHVEKGCYISTLVYISKFAAAYPAERAAPLTVQSRRFDGPHTIALLTWQGRWWGRDEYCGVFEIREAVGDGTVTAWLQRSAESALELLATQLARRGLIPTAPKTRPNLSVASRTRDVATARRLLRCATEQFWIRSEGREIPVVYFRPAPDRIAVYDPQSGTATAETALTDAAHIVVLVAARLGYTPDSVRREATASFPVLLASAAVSSGGRER